MKMKYIVIDTDSTEKLEEVSRHFDKFNVRTVTPIQYLSEKLPKGHEDPITERDVVTGELKAIHRSLWNVKRMFPDSSLNEVIRLVEREETLSSADWFNKQTEDTMNIIHVCLHINLFTYKNKCPVEDLLDSIIQMKFGDLVACISEHSKLIGIGGKRHKFVSHLRVWEALKSVYNTPKDEFYHTTEGTLLEKDVVENAWGWDGRFVPDGLDMTYAELREKGLKISPRDVVVGMFIRKYLWFEQCINWEHSDAMRKVMRQKVLNIDYKEVEDCFFGWNGRENHLIPFRNLCSWTAAQGLFLRTVKSKRMGIYWWPTGNGGIPVTRKPKDPMHERTFHMHDLTHFVVPDLIHTGRRDIEKYNWWYVAYRVLTECVTLVVADMMYVHHAHMDGIKYRTAEDRKIYPIFREIVGERIDLDILPELVSASIDFGMRGSCAGFMGMFRKYNPDGDIVKFEDSLDKFKNKYASYLVQDLKWTQQNVDDIGEEFKYWWDNLVPRCMSRGLGWETVEEIILGRPDGEDVFDYMGNICVGKIKVAMSGECNAPKSAKVMRFSRWSLGQLMFFSRYKWVPLVRGWESSFVNLVEKIWDEGSDDLMDLFRSRWEWLLQQCVSQSVITGEDAEMYSDIFPIIDPHFIGYDYEERSHTEIMKSFMESY